MPPVSFIYNTYAETSTPFRIDAVPLLEPDAEYVAASFNEASTTIGLSALELLPSDPLATRRPPVDSSLLDYNSIATLSSRQVLVIVLISERVANVGPATTKLNASTSISPPPFVDASRTMSFATVIASLTVTLV